jgi:hypothetical protein
MNLIASAAADELRSLLSDFVVRVTEIDRLLSAIPRDPFRRGYDLQRCSPCRRRAPPSVTLILGTSASTKLGPHETRPSLYPAEAMRAIA